MEQQLCCQMFNVCCSVCLTVMCVCVGCHLVLEGDCITLHNSFLYFAVTYKWQVLPLPSPNDDQYEQTPYHRYGHTAVAYADKAFIFGGRNDKNGACNILFCFDGGKKLQTSLYLCPCLLHYCEFVGEYKRYCLYNETYMSSLSSSLL